MHDQQGEESSLLRTADGDQLAVPLDFHRSQDLDAHPTLRGVADGSPTSRRRWLQSCNKAAVVAELRSHGAMDVPRKAQRCHTAAKTEDHPMAPNTDTLPAETRTRAPEDHPSQARRGARTWVAIIAACVAVVAIAAVAIVAGDEGDTPATRLDPQAEQLERQAHLDGQANTHGRGPSAVTDEAATQYRRLLEAERYEREAHLAGQAALHGPRPVDGPAPTDHGDTPEPEYLPGSRHVPTR